MVSSDTPIFSKGGVKNLIALTHHKVQSSIFKVQSNKMEKVTVVKVGGAIVEDSEQLAQLLKDFAAILARKYWYMAVAAVPLR